MNVSKATLTLALTTALGTTGMTVAAENPFSMQPLSQGYMVSDAGMKEGEGKYGGNKDSTKAAEGKCGEGKCGESKTPAKAAEGKCGEGKCGGSKTPAKVAEGKCGEGKCGGSKN